MYTHMAIRIRQYLNQSVKSFFYLLADVARSITSVKPFKPLLHYLDEADDQTHQCWTHNKWYLWMFYIQISSCLVWSIIIVGVFHLLLIQWCGQFRWVSIECGFFTIAPFLFNMLPGCGVVIHNGNLIWCYSCLSIYNHFLYTGPVYKRMAE